MRFSETLPSGGVSWLTFLVLLLLSQPALARHLQTVAELAHRTRVLIDRDSITRRTEYGRTLREGVVSIDNSRNPAASVNAYAADSKLDVDCATTTLRIVWTRVYDRDGKVVRMERPGSLEEFASPRSDVERAALGALCSG